MIGKRRSPIKVSLNRMIRRSGRRHQTALSWRLRRNANVERLWVFDLRGEAPVHIIFADRINRRILHRNVAFAFDKVGAQSAKVRESPGGSTSKGTI